MAYNPNFQNNYTFHRNFRPPNFSIPQPQPTQSNFCIPQTPNISDQEYVKQFELTDNPNKAKCQATPNITQIREQLRQIVLEINKFNAIDKYLQENIASMSEEEWNTSMDELSRKKVLLDGLMMFNDTYLELIKRALAKRSAKRLRLKRARLEKKKEKQDQARKRAETSRKIDENLLKIKEVTDKAEKDQADKRQTDAVLREVTRKKHDARKSLAKLEALVKLRKARENTARGSGVSVSVKDADSFYLEIAKLQKLWTHKLSAYEGEESDLLARLKNDADVSTAADRSDQASVKCLRKWGRFLFGGATAQPQRDFGGDMHGFIAARSQWDHYISSEGSALPVGWVLPST